MLVLWYYIFLWTRLLCLAQSIVCDQDKQYKWPISNPTMCCQKCERGQFMKSRCNGRYETQCAPCQNGYYMDFYNNELQCRICSRCTKNYMMYKENCTTTSDAVCGCKSGYELHAMECKQILTTTAAPTTNTKTTQQQTPPPTRDSVWMSLSLCCACVCILLTCFILISRHTPACGRIISAADCFWADKKSWAGSSQCTEGEEVPMPVQETDSLKLQEEV